jgi:hypothetical protein
MFERMSLLSASSGNEVRVRGLDTVVACAERSGHEKARWIEKAGKVLEELGRGWLWH